jgi:tetraacyldisaccharide-1-P 4'-kinase
LTRLDSAREELSGDAFRDQRVGLVLGIARPARVLQSVPARVVCSSVRGDHHWWRAEEVHAFARKAKGMGAVALLTTGKDAVKMGFLAEGAGPGLPVFAIGQEVEIVDRPALEKLLGVSLPL